MFLSIRNLFSPPRFQAQSHALYVRIVEEARTPQFYADYGVPDTVDGRFDMITLHMFLLSERLKKEGTSDALELLRATTEVFFADMDRSLREMGSTDTGVGKRIKKMSQAFYGRLLAYQAACGDDAKLQEALIRNLYRGDNTQLAHAMAMCAYVQTIRKKLSECSATELAAGQLP